MYTNFKDKEIAERLLSSKAFQINWDKPFLFTSGIESPVHCDNKKVMSDVSLRNTIIYKIAYILKGKNVDAIAAVETGGVPWGAWVADSLMQPFVYVRKEDDERPIEGDSVKGKNVILIEDTVSTGASSKKAIAKLQNAGAEVDAVLAIYSHEVQPWNHPTPLYVLTNMMTILEVGQARDLISHDEAYKVLKWINVYK